MEENVRLKNEIELLSDEKTQVNLLEDFIGTKN